MDLSLRKKINLKRYFALSLLSLGICAIFIKSWREATGLFLAYGAIINSQLMFVSGMGKLLKGQSAKPMVQGTKKTAITLVVGKSFILILGLLLGVHLMGGRVIIPLVSYVGHLFILAICLKKE